MSHKFSTNLKRFPIFKKILKSLSWEENSLINQSVFLQKNLYFSLICPIVQKNPRLKYSVTTQIPHDWGTYLSESSSYYYLMASGGWNPWMKIRVVVLLLLFLKLALLESFFKMFKKALCEISSTDFLTTYMIDMENCWWNFTVGGSFKWQWMFLVQPKIIF